jgi:hypothetical protein
MAYVEPMDIDTEPVYNNGEDDNNSEVDSDTASTRCGLPCLDDDSDEVNRPWSAYADRYGPWISLDQYRPASHNRLRSYRRKIWRVLHKSGLSPLLHPDTPQMTTNFPPESFGVRADGRFEEEVQDFLREYQRQEMDGFTSASLHRLQAVNVSDRSVIGSEGVVLFQLSIPVHNLFLPRWWVIDADKQEARFDVARNQATWAAMEPAFKVVTAFLTHADLVPWWDALVSGTRSGDWFMQRFHRRTLEEVEQDPRGAKGIAGILNSMVGRTTWALVATNERLAVNDRVNATHGSVHGVSIPSFDKDDDEPLQVTIELASEKVAPLLIEDLSTSDRLICLFDLVAVILHELAVSTTPEGKPRFKLETRADMA